MSAAKTPADAADELTPIDNLYDENQRLRAENERLAGLLKIVSGSELLALRDRGVTLELLSTTRAELQEALDFGVAEQHDLVLSKAENERLRAALEQGRMLIGEMDARMPEQATEDEDGFITSYRIPVGPWHRILGWARGGHGHVC